MRGTTTTTADAGNRWIVAIAGVVMQLALGAVYAWSVFTNPLVQTFHWRLSEVTLTFTISIFTLGVAAFFGGLWMNRVGPRAVAMVAGIFYGVGVFGASLTNGNIAILYLTYGLIAGIGLGLGYIVPVATLVKWFPDRRGFITGIAVAGFGAGALITAPIAARLIQSVGVLQTFAILGVAYLIMIVGASLFMRNPPEGWLPAGWAPSARLSAQRAARDLRLAEAVRTWQWYALWALLFLNVSAGIAILGQASPMAQEITRVDALTAAGLVSLLSIANGSGRFLWAWFSDLIGRKWVFLVMYLLQVVMFVGLANTTSFLVFSVLAFIIITCYGGGFGTMPAFTTDYFGPRNIGPIYGLMLTAWGFGSVLGPPLAAYIRESTGAWTNTFYILAGILLVSAILPLVVRPPRIEELPAAVRREERRVG